MFVFLDALAFSAMSSVLNNNIDPISVICLLESTESRVMKKYLSPVLLETHFLKVTILI